MKAYFPANSVSRSSYSEPAIPQWVSEMGLEWLYCLLSGSSSVKGAARS